MNTLELIREELQDIRGLSRREQLLCASGLIRAIGEIQISEGKFGVVLSSECGAAVSTAIALLKSLFNATVELSSRPAQIRKGRCMEAAVYGDEALSVLKEVSVLTDEGIAQSLPAMCDGELSAYLRGLFLGAGTLYIPEQERPGGFHLEISVFSEILAEELIKALNDYNIEFKLIEKKMQILYIKEAEQIGEFCAFIGAPETALKAYLVKTEREMRGKVNRDNNCAVYNMDKTALASAHQIQAIEIIERSEGGLDRLSAPLAELAKIRKKYPEATLDELAELLSDKPSKSGVNHRLRRLAELAKEINDKNTED